MWEEGKKGETNSVSVSMSTFFFAWGLKMNTDSHIDNISNSNGNINSSSNSSAKKTTSSVHNNNDDDEAELPHPVSS